ncbi:FtsK/SpoIIIE family DNA translocase [Helicobacter cappadocius]|uniref:DNA translocase FtsK 4TM domain-containing protein n=1 Tax=Helicobacter cappadocius TaxID=3063998 RepID=A0AA90PJS5_9HELI|nr:MULTISPECIES: DNA translocase FtsK [unclassified Helicobacter]MDO7252582.1 DNA translocase FtsK 4TM domain-containing protein [Helicobacter sp. faydin-H75]MDP2538449.1 DNA translocase FtsK 4TM domain-containing protein [Helicobacter sp. faydin-H76]
MGKFGVFFAEKNIYIFGYFSYVYLLFLIYPAYRLYKNQEFNQRRLELILGGILGFLGLLIAQAMIFQKGFLGQIIFDFLHPFIGTFGIFILVLLMFFIAYIIFFQRHFMRLTLVVRMYFKKVSDFIKDVDFKTFGKHISIFDKTKNDAHFHPKPISDIQIFNPTSISNKEDEDSQDTLSLKAPEIRFNENNIKVTYNHVVDKNDEEKKYADMVRLVGEDEEGEVRKADVEYFLDKNKKFFDQLSKEHFEEQGEQKSNKDFEKIIRDISKNIQTTKKISKEEVFSDISHLDEKSSLLKEDLKSDEVSHFQEKSVDNFNSQEYLEASQTIQQNQGTDIIGEIPSFTQNIPTYRSKTVIVKELSENTQLLQELEFGEPEKPKDYKLPNLDLLEKPKTKSIQIDENEIDQKIQDLLAKLKMFKIDGDISRTYSGPIVTTFEFKPAANVKVSRILTLGDDLAMALRAQSIRIQAPIPGKDVVGIEIPNAKTEIIYLREILESDLFENSSSPLTLALGKDIVGNPFITDLKKLPHLLIAGTTGSGKSVGVNSMILSLLFRNSPDNLKLIMIDPKMVEFSMYSDIPHLLTPIITDPKKAISALASAVNEMERRYKIMSESKTKNIDKYNPKAKQEGLEVFPFLVIIIDELADLMMTGGKEAEFPIARIAQMGRAAGLHLIVATQRPSVDVVTGLIKTNLPSRISFKVGSKIDSRVVLDTEGAQSLLGRGDMLFTPPGVSGVVRLHAPWASEEEIEEIVEFIKSQREVEYDKSFFVEESNLVSKNIPSEGGELIDDAKRIILQDRKTSISYLQRKLGVGYNKSASIIEELESQGFLSPPNSKGIREIVGN